MADEDCFWEDLVRVNQVCSAAPEPEPEPEGYRFYMFNTNTGEVRFGDLPPDSGTVTFEELHAPATAYMSGAFNRFQSSIAGDPYTNALWLARSTATSSRSIARMTHDGALLRGEDNVPRGLRSPYIAVSSNALFRLTHPTATGNYSYDVTDVSAGSSIRLSSAFPSSEVERYDTGLLGYNFAATDSGQFILRRPGGQGLRMARTSGSSIHVKWGAWLVPWFGVDPLDRNRIIGIINNAVATAEIFDDGSTSALTEIAYIGPNQWDYPMSQMTSDGTVFVFVSALGGYLRVGRDGTTQAISVVAPDGWPAFNPNYTAICRISD